MDNKCSELGVAGLGRTGAGAEGGRVDADADGADMEGTKEGGAELYQEDVEVIDVKSSPFTVQSSERKVIYSLAAS